ncbi:MAG: Crp/Fnr family transcriptional regulator [Dehalobacter sp.]|nr:Crp/Fnr family transcriptional regulator [Dehalobacter sp.]
MAQWEAWSPWTENMIDDEMVQKLLKLSKVEKYEKGEVIYWEGLDNRLFLLLSGKVEVSITSAGGRKRTVAIREARTFIDDVLVDGLYYAVTITCLTPVDIAVFEQRVLTKAGYEDPSILDCMLKSVILKLQGLSFYLAGQTFEDAEDRIYFLLINLAKKYGIKNGNTYYLEKQLTHQFIADIVGSTRVRVTQSIKNLKNKGLVTKKNGRFVVFVDDNHKVMQ